MDKYLEDIQIGVFEAAKKEKTPIVITRSKKKRPLKPLTEIKQIAKDIIGELAGQNYDFTQDDDWESAADQIMQDDYDLSDQEETEVADLLPAAIKKIKKN